MLCAPDLESRQSMKLAETFFREDALRPGFGIKAKPPGEDAEVGLQMLCAPDLESRQSLDMEPGAHDRGCSAPRIWNQGKAR